ncbi:MAG TPA: RiPP maturation radical SAM C-methyltransferase [Streptosporangiaceae bacterium]|nr:RiPP maturation radical SAM C-methyltransferase [Streptosporangiaceae bacterium]
MDKPDVCLVSMPYAMLRRPSMALGLLQGILHRDGIPTVAAHANIWFAEKVGPARYDLTSRAPTTYLMGEWTFAAAAFPGSPNRDERYLSMLSEESGKGGRYAAARQALAKEARWLRAAATRFVDEAAQRVLATGARVVGCTSTFEQHVASLALLRRIRELDPGVITMLGGANCETVMGEATHRCFPWVDYVVSGEADGLITDLCRLALTAGRDASATELPAGVLGPCHRAGEPSALSPANLRRALFRDLDSLPTPEFDDYFTALAESSLRTFGAPGLPLETSRGCWWGEKHHCTFCGLNGSSMAYRSKSPERVLTEIRQLEDRYGISDFEVVDNILDMRYFKTLLPELAADGRRRRLFYEVKANLTRQQLELMAHAGICWVQPGIESLHSAVLGLMDKGVQGWRNIQLLKWSGELGIRLTWSVLWGFPDERDEYYQQMARWLPLLEHLQAPVAITRLRYDRYSVYEERARRGGMILFPIAAMSYVYPLPDRDLSQLTYFFTTDPDPDHLDSPGRDMDRIGPGVKATYGAVRHWREAFGSASRPVLSMTDRGHELDIVDTRACASASRIRLRGVPRAVILACRAAPQADRLAAGEGLDHGLRASPGEVEDAVAELIAARLILPIDGRLVSLPLTGRTPPLSGESDFPGGNLSFSAAPGR